MNNKVEIGRIGQLRSGNNGHGSLFMEEFLPELRGSRGAQVYTEMADNDATVGAILFAIENLMRNCELHIEPAGESSKDKECAEFVESCMNDMERTWSDTLSEILSFLTYGWSYHEIVYKRRIGRTSSPVTNSKHDDGLIGWRKLPIRSQETLYGWEYKEGTDDLIGMTQQPPPDYGTIFIPIEKALHFRTRSRKDNPEGRSILRTAYRAHYCKKRIEEIEGYGIERDLAGFPVLYGPEGMDLWDTNDPDMQRALMTAQQLVSSIRRDQAEGIVLPRPGEGEGWKLELLSSGSRRQFDTTETIDRWDKRIATSVLADFVMLGQQQVGSFALADSKTKIFALSIGTYLDIICEVFNNQAIPRLIDINGDHFKGITDYPKMVHGDIDEVDLTQYSAYIQAMVSTGVIVPDDELEAEVRRIGGLPEKVDTGEPRTMPGEEQEPEDGGEKPESKSAYKVTSIMEKYERGSITREAAAQLMTEFGLDEQKVKFYLDEAETAKDAKAKEQAKLDREKAAQRAAQGAQGRGKAKAKQTPTDDEKDAREAAEAKKSLGR